MHVHLLVMNKDQSVTFHHNDVRSIRLDWYNFRNGTAEHTVIGWNGTLILTLR